MGLQINRPPQETVKSIEHLLREALPGASVSAQGMGGHFEIRVVAEQFEGKNTLSKQRLVLGAIKGLMKGERAPVHAVDRIEALTPQEASAVDEAEEGPVEG